RGGLRDADDVFIVFGPGLGLGDEITCLELVRRIVDRFGEKKTTIFSCYPGLWAQLLPAIRSHQYRGHPLRPYRAVRLAATAARPARRDAKAPARRVLAIAIAFDGNGLHHAVLPRVESLDVFELALGLHGSWIRHGTDPWLERVETPATSHTS